MQNGARRPRTLNTTAATPRQPSQALARSIDDELLSASVSTPIAAASSSTHSGRHSSAVVRTALDEDSARATRGPLARADSRDVAPTNQPAAWNISFGGPPPGGAGTKRKRKPSPQAASVRARLEGRGGTHGAENTAAAPGTASGRAAQVSGMPTPPAPPPRRPTVLQETPLFIREERAAAADKGAGRRSSEPLEASPAPVATSFLARGLSRLRSSASVVLPLKESTVRGSHSRARRENRTGVKVGTDDSPWNLSTIPSSTARRGKDHHLRRHQSRGGGSKGERASEGGSSVSSFSRAEMLHFLQPSPTHGGAASSSSTDRGPSAPPLASGDARHAALSSISSSLADIVSSSRSSLRSSLAAAPRVDGTAAHGSGGTHSHSSGRDLGAARSPTMLEPPNVSSIHGDEDVLRRRQQAALDRQRHERNNDVGAATGRAHGFRTGGDEHTIQLPGHNAAATAFTQGLAEPSRRPRPSATAAASKTALAGGRPTSTTTGGRDSVGARPRRSRLQSRLASLSRLFFSVLIVLFFTVNWMCVLLPVLADLDGPQDTLTRYYVNPVSELHALYRVAPSSLTEAGVQQLYGRALSEGVERLERSTVHLADVVSASTRADQLLYLQQLVRAYVAVQHRARLYARSRDESVWRRLVAYPLADAWRFGVARHGLRYSLRRLVRKPSLRYVLELLRGTANCLAQNEELPCPTLLFVEQSMMILSAPDPDMADDEESIVQDVNAAVDTALRSRRQIHTKWPTLRRDWDSEVYLDTLLTFVRETIRHTTRGYNHPTPPQ